MGAGIGIAAIHEAALQDPRFDPVLVASPPVADRFRDIGLAFERVAEGDAGAIVRRVAPDALIAGLSGPESGIDEALLGDPALSGVPRFVLQDFWGDANADRAALPDAFLVIDDEAARLTRLRFAREAIVVGSVKHAGYADIDAAALAADARAGHDPRSPLILVAGQPLWSCAGYRRMLESMAAALAEAAPEARLLYRAHPKEAAEQAGEARAILGAEADTLPTVEPMLAGADAILSIFSTVAWDALMLARVHGRVPPGIVFALADAELRALYHVGTDIDHVPPAAMGLAIECIDAADLAAQIREALAHSKRKETGRRLMEKLADPRDSPAVTLDAVAAAVERARACRRTA